MTHHFNPFMLVVKIIFWCTIGIVVWLVIKVVQKLSTSGEV